MRRAASVHRSCTRCSLTRTYISETMAARHWPNHGCDGELDRRRRAQARAEHLASTSVVRDCQCTTVQHEHGSLGAYCTDGCRCTLCRKAQSDYAATRSRQQAYGTLQPAYQDAAPVRAHVRALMAGGIGLQRVAAVAGVPSQTVGHLVYGKRDPDDPGGRIYSAQITVRNARRLLAVEASLDIADPGAHWPILGSTRRLRALVAIGWNLTALRRELGWARAVVDDVVHQRQTYVTVAHARDARQVFERLAMKLPPTGDRYERQVACRARNMATHRDWAPPLAWDDDTIDDPTATPDRGATVSVLHVDVDEVAIERRLAGEKHIPLSPAAKTELLRRWQATGRSLAECERVTGVNPHRYLNHQQEAS